MEGGLPLAPLESGWATNGLDDEEGLEGGAGAEAIGSDFIAAGRADGGGEGEGAPRLGYGSKSSSIIFLRSSV